MKQGSRSLGPRPSSGDTGAFRERRGTAGICRVESTAADQQNRTKIKHKTGTSLMMLPSFLNTPTNWDLLYFSIRVSLFGRSVIIGLGKVLSYQWFTGSQQELLSVKLNNLINYFSQSQYNEWLP